MYLSVVIPAYNEEKRLPKTLIEIDKYLKKQKYVYEIIVVSDGSKDKTGDLVRYLQKEIKGLRLIDNKENHGKGFVVRQAMLEAAGQYRLFMDADNATTIDQVENFFPYLQQGFDLAIGSRDVPGAKLDPPQPPIRVFVGNVFNLMTQIIVGLWGIWDTQCGFKMMTGEAAEKILPKCKIDRWAFDPEILKLAKREGYSIKEVPVHWKNDLESKVKLRSTIRMAFDLLRIRWNLLTFRYGFKFRVK